MSAGAEAGRGGLILTFGIVGLLCCGPLGIAAWVMGAGDLKKIEQGQISPEAKSMTQVGMILGIVAVALWALAIVVQLFVGIVQLGGRG